MSRRRSRFAASRRNLDKKIVNAVQATDTGQSATVLFTSTFPCTITGIRWSIGVTGGTTSGCTIYWALIMVRDGDTISTMSTSDGADFYNPEQEVLSFGLFQLDDKDSATGGPVSMTTMGSTKTMRKYMGGDTLQFITISTIAGCSCRALVQFFCKV